MEHLAAPQHLPGGLTGEGRDLLCILLAQLAVDGEELGDVVALGFDFGRSLEDCRDDAIDQAVVHFDPAFLERLRKHPLVEVCASHVAGLVAAEYANLRIEVLVVAPREEGDLHRWILHVDPRHTGGGRRVAWILSLADNNAGPEHPW